MHHINDDITTALGLAVLCLLAGLVWTWKEQKLDSGAIFLVTGALASVTSGQASAGWSEGPYYDPLDHVVVPVGNEGLDPVRHPA